MSLCGFFCVSLYLFSPLSATFSTFVREKLGRGKSKERRAESREKSVKIEDQGENIKDLVVLLLFILISTVIISRVHCSQKSSLTIRYQKRRIEGDP